MKLKFYICKHCGNIVAMVEESGIPVVCCGEDMHEITPNTSDGDGEKHVPVFDVEDGVVHVKVGESEHPSVVNHFIKWIAIQTSGGNQRKCLKAGDKPEACFALCEGDELEAVYEYCNVHGLWMAEA